jgi:hypothetical protein
MIVYLLPTLIPLSGVGTTCFHHQPINVPTAEVQAFLIDYP